MAGTSAVFFSTPSAAGVPAHVLREETMAENDPVREGILVLVCVECGKEYMYESEDAPEDKVCDKCGNTVFRSFYTGTDEDEVDDDYRTATERAVTPEDGATDVTRGDVRDLGSL